MAAYREALVKDNVAEELLQNTNWTISIPVAINQTARRAIIANRVIQIDVPEITNGKARETFDPRLRSQTHVRVLKTSPANVLHITGLTTVPQTSYDELSHFKSSPSTKYLALIRELTLKATKDTVSYGQLWWLQVFVDLSFNITSDPHYSTLCCTQFFAVPEIAVLSPSRGVAFHPYLPYLVFPQTHDGLPQTYLWKFTEHIEETSSSGHARNPFPISDDPILDPCFDERGTYVSGTDAPIKFGDRHEVFRDMCNPIRVRVPPNYRSSSMAYCRTLAFDFVQAPQRGSVEQITTLADILTRQKAPVRRTDRVCFDQDGSGHVHVSQLGALTDSGAVVLCTLDLNQSFTELTITRLPDEVRKSAKVCLLRTPSNGSLSASSGAEHVQQPKETISLVLNKAHEKYYTLKDADEKTLPAIVERSVNSIPAIVSTIPIAWRED